MQPRALLRSPRLTALLLLAFGVAVLVPTWLVLPPDDENLSKEIMTTVFQSREVFSGHYPFWDPWVAFGTPEPRSQALIFHPFLVLVELLPLGAAIGARLPAPALDRDPRCMGRGEAPRHPAVDRSPVRPHLRARLEHDRLPHELLAGEPRRLDARAAAAPPGAEAVRRGRPARAGPLRRRGRPLRRADGPRRAQRLDAGLRRSVPGLPRGGVPAREAGVAAG